MTRSQGPRVKHTCSMESDKTICPAGICDAQTFMQSFSIHSIKDKSKSAAHVSLRQRRSAGQTIIGHSCPMNESWPKGTIKKFVQEQSTITMFKNLPVRLSRFKSEYDYNVQEPAVAKRIMRALAPLRVAPLNFPPRRENTL